jgi:hypothetical protein
MDREPAHVVDELCARELGAGVRRELFCHAGHGLVYGLELRDDRRVVLKAHPPGRGLDVLHEMVALQNHLASRGLYAPTVVGGPLAFGPHLATVEALVEGERRDDADPLAQALLGEALARVVAACRPLAASSSLPAGAPSALVRLSADEVVIGHADWTLANARFAGRALVVAYGWGNLQRWVGRSSGSP